MEGKEENKSVESGNNKSQYYNLFKEIQNQIKDKVITKYLTLIEHQAKELTELKKENTLLKNQLTYILKKILLNKHDYTSLAKANRLSNLNNSITYNRSMLLNNNNSSIRKSNSMLRPHKSCENYRCITENITSRYKETSSSLVNIHGNDITNANVDNKISGYLNSLYRHNFKNKAGGNNYLNKNQSLLDELFPKNSSFYMNSEKDQLLTDIDLGNNLKSKKNRDNNSLQRRASYKKNNDMRNNYGLKNNKNNSIGRRYKPKYTDLNNNSTKKRNKDNNNFLDTSKYNTINNGNRKNNNNKTKKPVGMYPKRSPFIANKF